MSTRKRPPNSSPSSRQSAKRHLPSFPKDTKYDVKNILGADKPPAFDRSMVNAIRDYISGLENGLDFTPTGFTPKAGKTAMQAIKANPKRITGKDVFQYVARYAEHLENLKARMDEGSEVDIKEEEEELAKTDVEEDDMDESADETEYSLPTAPETPPRKPKAKDLHAQWVRLGRRLIKGKVLAKNLDLPEGHAAKAILTSIRDLEGRILFSDKDRSKEAQHGRAAVWTVEKDPSKINVDRNMPRFKEYRVYLKAILNGQLRVKLDDKYEDEEGSNSQEDRKEQEGDVEIEEQPSSIPISTSPPRSTNMSGGSLSPNSDTHASHDARLSRCGTPVTRFTSANSILSWTMDEDANSMLLSEDNVAERSFKVMSLAPEADKERLRQTIIDGIQREMILVPECVGGNGHYQFVGSCQSPVEMAALASIMDVDDVTVGFDRSYPYDRFLSTILQEPDLRVEVPYCQLYPTGPLVDVSWNPTSLKYSVTGCYGIPGK